MNKALHPDRLDAVSASQDASVRHLGIEQAPADADEVQAVLGKLLAQKTPANLPKKQRPKSIVLASISLLMVRYRAYSEKELTDLLHAWLSAAELSVDRVSCRRHLIEYGFVRRDRAGQRYIADYAKIETVLGSGALDRADALIHSGGSSTKLT